MSWKSLRFTLGTSMLCGGADVLKLLASEDVKVDEMDLGVAVLASLRGGHLHNLAGPVLDHDEASLAKSRALHGEGLGGARVSLGEVMIVVLSHPGILTSISCRSESSNK